LDDRGQVTEGSLAYSGKVIEGTAAQMADTFERGLAGWVVKNRTGAFVPSTREDPRWLKRMTEEGEAESKSAISVPLQARDRVVGVLTLVHPDEDHFAEEDLELLTAIADQAGIAVENARLFAAEQQKRAFLATLHEIARSINSFLDPPQVFPLILEQLERLVQYDSASIFVLEEGQLRLAAARGFSGEHDLTGLRIPVEGNLWMGKVLSSRKPQVLADVRGEPDWLDVNRLPETEGVRAWIGAPLLVREEAVGVLTVDSHEPGAYGDSEVEVVSAFAHQAATAVANAELYAESQRRMEAMVALAETARVITASLDLEEVLGRILSQTIQTLEVEAASLALIDETSGELEFKAASGEGSEALVGITLEKGKGVAGWVAERGEPAIVDEAQDDPRFYARVDEQIGYQTRALACVPIRVQNEIIGVLEAINPRQGRIGERQLEVLLGIAGLAGTAIQHARLFSETQEARQRYAGLFEDSIDPILITDLEGLIGDANHRAQAFLGRSLRALLGESIQRLHNPDETEEVQALDALAPGAAFNYEGRAWHEDGRELPIEVHVKRIDVGPQPVLQWILRDISERQALDQLRADLTSMIFHDLRSPLGNVISSLEVMEEALPGEDELAPVLSVAQRSSRRLSRLIDSLLDIDHLETGEAVLDRQPVSIPALVDEAIAEVSPVAEAKGHRLEVQAVDGSLPEVEADEGMIRRVIINLLENAVKYTPGGGEIRLSADRGEGEVRIGVEDTGPGISQKDRKRIFDKFARIHHKGRAKGLGLGLAFCRLAVEAHGGKIWVESEPEKGSAFYFTLPV
jgi:PAS domain S-box-containing protein